MVGFRISGVVRAARRAHERMQLGIPPGERDAFLQGVATTVAHVEGLCAKNGATPRDLPAPSRRALGDLQALARLAPDALPAPRDGEEAHRPLAISNVVSALDRTLCDLSRVKREGAAAEDAMLPARACVEAVERICREKRTSLAALPIRTGEAYALLRWLTDEENLAHYLDRRDAAARAFEAVLGPGGAPSPGVPGGRWQGLRPLIRFQPGSRVYRLAPEGGILDCRLGVGWLGADDDDFETLGAVALYRDAAPRAHVAAHQTFLDSEDFGALHHELTALREGSSERPKGRVCDLDVLFDHLNERFFRRALPRPRLTWDAGTSIRRFGCYVASLDQARIDVRLDDERVPEFVAEFVLYHELLHKVHGVRMRGRRRYAHTPAFRADERRFPRWREAETWLSRIASGGAGRVEREETAGETRCDRCATSPPVPARPDPVQPAPAPRPLVPRRYGPPRPTVEPLHSGKVARNAPCPCGSGRKYKKCCLGSEPPVA